ncbi:NAD(P)H-quinone oxidoreductase [Tautonia plasticadhaerens]|uniref:Phthiocerol synthesis polyketide synthase type I PpsC n=1 Tax=Tautonia plasticadhaerens TaxID=2527974 RepID=A0A518GW86_9BACT|nr:NAD(P)H-quinone oxidoreductase [Tautonia plasticadhaerens]QDV32839.1 Phthiocerol synthesis polyketide synthase type I PpsC [Tautonia plasticadhaerens]
MRAVVITRPGGPEVLEVREVPRPEARGDRVLVRVRASGLNRADTLQARGMYPAPPGSPPDVPGLEFAGEVENKGPDAIGSIRPGDRVFGIVGGGGLAEYVSVPERMLVRIPANLDWAEAAAVPEVFLTAFDAIDLQAELRPGEAVLIHAVGGGVGSAALQIARAMGCPTFGTARTASKLERAGAYGLDVGIDTSTEEFPKVILDRTGGEGVPAIIDHVGGPYLSANLDALATKGRLVVVGLLGGRKAELDLSQLLAKRARLVGTTLRARPIEEKIAATRRFADRVVPWLERRTVMPVVDRAFPLDEVVAAASHMESNRGFGKVVLMMGD